MGISNQILQKIRRVVFLHWAYNDLCLAAHPWHRLRWPFRSTHQWSRGLDHKLLLGIIVQWLYLFEADMDRLLPAPLHRSGRRSDTPELTLFNGPSQFWLAL